MPDLIYKICRPEEWAGAALEGVYAGSDKDQEDGFLHFSLGDQLAGTLERYYADAKELTLVAVKATALGNDLRYEPSTGGALFPHLYGNLPLSAVVWAKPIHRRPGGAFILPSDVT